MGEAVAEILSERNAARLRSCPRVLKRAVRNYPPKRTKHENWPQPTKQPIDAIVILK